MNALLTRRRFLRTTLLGSATAWMTAPWCPRVRGSPNEKLGVAFVGVHNRAGEDLAAVAKETALAEVIALCDVDERFLAEAKQKHPAARTYRDFRPMLEGKDIDAVVVGTPDHTHAVASAAALRTGRHVYCEKPLTRTLSEARTVTELARQHKALTQIGTQIHAGANYRRVVELVQSGAIGEVREVHVWVGATYGGMDRPKDTPPVPAGLDWELWLGPVPYRPYSPEYAPFKWRHWWAFGGGALADFGCHFMDLPHWALNLTHPVSAEVVEGPPVHPESTPPWLIVRYQHPARSGKLHAISLPPVTLTWYHGGKQPTHLLSEEHAQYYKSGVLFLGAHGSLLADYGRRVLLPEKDFASFDPPAPFIPDSIGHHKEWLTAIKNGGPTTCGFAYSGPLTEAALLGNVAFRVGKKLEWDSPKLQAVNCPQANQFIEHQYRAGWRL